MGKRPMCTLALLYIVLILICTSADIRKGTFLTSAETALEDGKRVWVYGEVINKELKGENFAITLQHAKVVGSNNQEYKILVYFQNSNSCQIGDKIKIYGKIRRLQISTNKGMFNSALYYKAKGIQYTMQGNEIQVLKTKRLAIQERIFRFRVSLYERLYQMFEENTATLLGAILLGIKNDIAEETKELYQRAGIFHLISISGLHISCIGLALYKIIRKISGSFAVSGITSSIFLIFYTVLSGSSVSTLRAVIMAMIMMGAWYLGRTYDILSSLSLAAILILLESPYYLYQAGFQLSFGAVLGICVVAPKLVGAFAGENSIAKAFFSNLGIQFTTLPLILYYYYEIPVYSLLLNLILVPLMSLVVFSGIFSLLLSFLSIPIGRFLGGAAILLLFFYEKAATLTLKLPNGVLRWGQPSLGGIIIYYGILIVAIGSIERMNQKKQKILAEEKHAYGVKGMEDNINKICFLGIFLACIFLKVHKSEPLRITMLDVGQGDCMVLEYEQKEVYLVDGGSSDVKQVGKYRIVPFLKSEGIRKIQGIFISHMDSDHISGIKELLEYEQKGEFQIDTVYLPDISGKDEAYQEMETLISQSGIPIVYVARNMILQSGNLGFQILQPLQLGNYSEKNETSMVFNLKYKEFSMLFTGDIEGKGEAELKSSGLLEDITVLKAAHHGSEYTMCQETLNQITPEVTLISCGKDNSYGHPHKALLERINNLNSQIYVTMNDGAITVETDGLHMVIYEKCK
ncbi:MAG: DNA internalization-related competence protein ComEC/Rec2 [Lachnospiraceae bacterium]|nr:DNA internalization-related competence protein ComEC/Rec2 [Lachnospiraceae bacterium]